MPVVPVIQMTSSMCGVCGAVGDVAEDVRHVENDVTSDCYELAGSVRLVRNPRTLAESYETVTRRGAHSIQETEI